MAEHKTRLLQVIAESDQINAAMAEANDKDGNDAAGDIFIEAIQNGAYVLCADDCPSDGCTLAVYNFARAVHIPAYTRARVRYGDEHGDLTPIAAHAAEGTDCLHCQVRPGQWHHVGCIFEQCPYCGGYISMECKGDHFADIAREVTPPGLQESMRDPARLALYEALRGRPAMDGPTLEWVIALSQVFVSDAQQV